MFYLNSYFVAHVYLQRKKHTKIFFLCCIMRNLQKSLNIIWQLHFYTTPSILPYSLPPFPSIFIKFGKVNPPPIWREVRIMIYIKFTSSSHYSILVNKTYKTLNTYNENNYCQLKMLIIEKKRKKTSRTKLT